MDLFATLHKLAGVDLPQDRVLDSFDLSPVLLDGSHSSREVLFYYRGYRLMAARYGPWKMHLMTQDGYGEGAKQPVIHEPPLLFHLENDPGEKWSLTDRYPEIVEQIRQRIAAHRRKMNPSPSQLEL
jgi:arylsulfatase A-like enzyme